EQLVLGKSTAAHTQAGLGGGGDGVRRRQVPGADALPAFLDSLGALQVAGRRVPVLHGVAARQETAVCVAVVVEHGDGHVLPAEIAVDHRQLPILDAVTGGELAALKNQQPAEWVVVPVVRETE